MVQISQLLDANNTFYGSLAFNIALFLLDQSKNDRRNSGGTLRQKETAMAEIAAMVQISQLLDANNTFYGSLAFNIVSS